MKKSTVSIVSIYSLFVAYGLLCGSVCVIECANILALFPYSSFSHFAAFRPYLKLLSGRGHNLTVFSHYRSLAATDSAAYKHVSLSESGGAYNIRTLDIGKLKVKIPLSLLMNLYFLYLSSRQTRSLMQTVPALRGLLESPGETDFDLILLATFNSRHFLTIPYKLNKPFVLLSSFPLFPFYNNNLGVPINPSYVISNMAGIAVGPMSFTDRLAHSVNVAFTIFVFDTFFDREALQSVRNQFGPMPNFKDIEKNCSLVLVNAHWSVSFSKPLPPNIVEVGGLHLEEPQPLPSDIEKFINGSEHGVIYFCMGSLLRGSSFPEDKRKAFLYAFSKIPQRVLWKWEGDNLPGKPDNVMIAKWMPQRDILAHPNVKLFISHGGLLGTNEAVYEGVPILGIPIFGDQRTNVKSIEASGAGELLDYNDISDEVVFGKIQKLLHDPKYRENAKELSRRYRDRPMSPLDTAVYWTEYVIRHKGAHHLRSAAVDLPWYQYLLLDVIAFVLLVLVVSLLSVYYSIKFTLRFIFRKLFGKKQPTKSEKSKKKLN